GASREDRLHLAMHVAVRTGAPACSLRPRGAHAGFALTGVRAPIKSAAMPGMRNALARSRSDRAVSSPCADTAAGEAASAPIMFVSGEGAAWTDHPGAHGHQGSRTHHMSREAWPGGMYVRVDCVRRWSDRMHARAGYRAWSRHGTRVPMRPACRKTGQSSVANRSCRTWAKATMK